MSVWNSLFVCPAIRKPKNLLCSDHHGKKSKVSSLVTEKHFSKFTRASLNNGNGNVSAKANDDLKVPLEGESSWGKGVGIVNFFQGKNIFITGGTGLLGKGTTYDVSLQTNVNGPKRIMSFAKKCKSLELLVHISTAYVNGEREGIILENPITMGENRRKDRSPFPRVNISDEVNLALKSGTKSTGYDATKDMKRLGMERAHLYGWHNTYQFTKAMGEMVIQETRGDIPVVIIRPAAIESCYKEPVPGWIQGYRVFDPLICSLGKGQLPAFLCKPDTPIDIIPLDMVVNATIAAIAKHGSKHMPELNIYQIASSVLNPVRFSDMFNYSYEYFRSQPLIESKSSTRISYYDNLVPGFLKQGIGMN
ncbi:PREDICTED: fatty acyl-CoA reductase 2-like [Erythranthe guttata]|uniref:fatty acyl-CoA reductase 2-like n=1 Tax=Erythranthe guttata TaxID=4155 RepID=UPI00064DCB4F|nr:PREDICTED: fatty acyl-CoA reductase 2-like [Erythranthe guttata]|eukprot:XP_012832964.1 PREDICTED: fatty acyl-CoA reductase 2-like [Erythranthe guttata]